MKSSALAFWSGTIVLMFLSLPCARAQELPPAKADALPATPVPVPYHDPQPVIDSNVLAEPCAHDKSLGLFFDGEILLLRARRRELDYAISSSVADGSALGTIESLEWKPNAGLRIGGGWRFGPEGWETGIYYTNFQTSDHQAIAKPPGGTLLATMTAPILPIVMVDTATANSRLTIDLLDLEAAHRYSVSDSFTIRLSGGGRFAWIDQRFTALYDGGDASNTVVKMPIRFHGGGLRVGCEGYWDVTRCLSIFAGGHGSLLLGNFSSRYRETTSNGATLIADVTDHFEKMVPVAELSLGLAWQGQYVHARLGYNLANWFGLVDSPDFSNFVHTGKIFYRTSDLSLSGLSFELGVNF